MKSLLPLVALSSFLSVSSFADEVIWREEFESDLKHVKAASQDSEVKPERVPDGGVDGGAFVRYELTGTSSLEGIRIEASEVPANRLLTVSFKARGNGEIMLSLLSKNGWAYTKSRTLSKEWQELSASKVTGQHDSSLSIYIQRPRKIFSAGTLEVDELTVSAAPALVLEDQEVQAAVFQAADYAKAARQIIVDGEDRGVGGGSPFVISDIPFPQTSRNVQVFARLRNAGEKDRYSLTSVRTGVTQQLRSASPVGEGGEWQWVKFADVSAEEAGDEISIQGWPEAGRGEGSLVTEIVFTTDRDLKEPARGGQNRD